MNTSAPVPVLMTERSGIASLPVPAIFVVAPAAEVYDASPLPIFFNALASLASATPDDAQTAKTHPQNNDRFFRKRLIKVGPKLEEKYRKRDTAIPSIRCWFATQKGGRKLRSL